MGIRSILRYIETNEPQGKKGDIMQKLLRRAETNLQSEKLIKFWNPEGIKTRAPLDAEVSAATARGNVLKQEAAIRYRIQNTWKM